MILVTGSTGTGKSTTLAAMIDHLNQTRRAQHHQPRGPDRVRAPQQERARSSSASSARTCRRFAEGVRAAMREDPDVILVGEMRDAETIRMAMTAAETGHLVLGTLHTTERGEDHRPHHRCAADRGARADQELPVAEPARGDHPGAGQDAPTSAARRAICEIMVMNKAIAKLIQTDQTHQIPTPAADGPRPRHAAARPGAARGITAKEIDPGRRLRLRHRQAPVLSAS